MQTKTTLSKSPIKIEISLDNMPKPVRRVLLVPGDINFHRLNHVIISVFIWENDSSYVFVDNVNRPKTKIGELRGKNIPENQNLLNPKRTYLQRSFLLKGKGAPFQYIYHHKYRWSHTITFQEITPEDLEKYDGKEVLLEYEGINPPENLGGAEAYRVFREIVNNPKNALRDALLEFVDWTPQDLEEEDDSLHLSQWLEDLMEEYEDILEDERWERKHKRNQETIEVD
ncbi:hypothetical protein KIH41_10615 [Litoribacter ruber]|uniref:IS1096 element passenger TnpR family protein n=1 Tax=Litoribacter ruber TaxID=702568 RepID=UPI001BDA49E7|nr:hypothetical protein [Litoribacter ruber]MBT0811728.1 hypothetical protein [Litoribacter ruber]